MPRPLWAIALLLIGLLAAFANVPHSAAQSAATVAWGQPIRVPSPDTTHSWFPDAVVDSHGRVHVLWNETDPTLFGTEDRDRAEKVVYSVWDGQQWWPHNDIVPPQQDIIRTSLAIDDRDVLHLLFDTKSRTGGLGLFYSQAPARDALSAQAWRAPWLVNHNGNTYLHDIGVRNGAIHIVYDDRGSPEGECPGCADIYYRRSDDDGRTWSPPTSLRPSGLGAARVQMEIDGAGVIHVAWDEGWDKFSGEGEEQYGVYLSSADEGLTWSTPITVSQPITANAQLTVGSDDLGGVMLVWRTTDRDYPGIYYQWSSDGGGNWTAARPLPSIVAKNWGTPFDRYDMATDSAGHIHLLVTGYASADLTAPSINAGPTRAYHFEWDGARWAGPNLVFAGGGDPEYPQIVVSAGNQLHATWFLRFPSQPYEVWYARGESGAPPVAVTPVPTPTPTSVPPTPTPVQRATPVPTLSVTFSPNSQPVPQPAPDGTAVTLLAISAAPVLLLIAIVWLIRRNRT